MNATQALTGVTPVQHATTLKGVTPALATLDIQAMDFLAQVGALIITVQTVYIALVTEVTTTTCLAECSMT